MDQTPAPDVSPDLRGLKIYSLGSFVSAISAVLWIPPSYIIDGNLVVSLLPILIFMMLSVVLAVRARAFLPQTKRWGVYWFAIIGVWIIIPMTILLIIGWIGFMILLGNALDEWGNRGL